VDARRVDKARALLAEARDAKGAKKVADLARAAEVYARGQKLGDELIGEATALKIEAMTMLDEFLQKTAKNKGARGNPGGRGAKIVRSQSGTAQPPTLAESGVSKKESSDAQALAKVKKQNPELYAGEDRQGDRPARCDRRDQVSRTKSPATRSAKKKRAPNKTRTTGPQKRPLVRGIYKTTTDRQELFVREYLIDMNATAAYLRAGYEVEEDASAAVCACKLLRNAKIADATVTSVYHLGTAGITRSGY